MNADTRPRPYASEAARRQAVRERDAQADAWFLYSVSTTGVVCRPSCAARPARPQNVAFHPDLAQARAAGFRPCLRCRPDLPPRSEREAELVARACRLIDAAEAPPALQDLARALKVSPHHFHRLFRRLTGVTPKAYAAALRQARVQTGLEAGEPVTAAMYAAGFNSSGRFYEAADAMLGMTPSARRAGGAGETIRHVAAACELGIVLVASSTRGVCAILLGDDAVALRDDLARRFPRAVLAEGGAELAGTVADIVALIEQPRSAATLPLDIRGTAFQRRVWQALRAIPAGATATYGQLARDLDAPGAARAVAAACAANPLAVAVPCHRVVGTDGKLAGYRWGIERKRALLRREAG